MNGVFIRSGVLLCWLLSALGARAEKLDEPLRPLPSLKELNLDARKVKLGETLYNDKRLSRYDSISCASCHNLALGGSDGRQFPVAIDNKVGTINTPTVFNAGNSSYQFWSGRVKTLEEVTGDHLADRGVFESSWNEVNAKLTRDKAFSDGFRAVYPDGIQAANVSDALASYVRSLTTPSRFDRYLQGDASAITADELAGYKKFKDFGCVACHQGVNVGGNMFQMLGVMRDYFTQRGNPTTADLGRYNVTKLESDKHVFKVPSLRNIALTAPYFHDGTATTLNDAVNVMFKYQLGRRGTDADKASIIKFLNTLTGEKLIAK